MSPAFEDRKTPKLLLILFFGVLALTIGLLSAYFILSKKESPSLGILRNNNSGIDLDIEIISQESLTGDFGVLNFMVLQFLLVDDIKIVGESARIDLDYLINGEKHSLQVQTANIIGTPAGMFNVNSEEFKQFIKKGDLVDVHFVYTSDYNKVDLDELESYFAKDYKPNKEVSGDKHIGNFGSMAISEQEIRNRLNEDSAVFSSKEILILTIKPNNSQIGGFEI